jgi:hypothetical protein
LWNRHARFDLKKQAAQAYDIAWLLQQSEGTARALTDEEHGEVGSFEAEPAFLFLPSQDTHRTSVPTVFRPVVHTALSMLGRAVHKVTMRVHGYVHSVEGQDVTFLKMLENHVLELRLRLHNLQLPATAVPQLLRFECWPVSAAAYELTAGFVEVSRAGPQAGPQWR